MIRTALCIAALSAAVAPVASPQQAERIIPDALKGAYEGQFHYAPAVRAGDFLYLGGVVAALRPGESEWREEDLETAFDRAFQQIELVLKEAGASWANVIEMTTFHTEVTHHSAAFLKVKDKWVKEPYPAWTAIDVDRLYTQTGLVEIKVVAFDPRD